MYGDEDDEDDGSTPRKKIPQGMELVWVEKKPKKKPV